MIYRCKYPWYFMVVGYGHIMNHVVDENLSCRDSNLYFITKTNKTPIVCNKQPVEDVSNN